MAMTFRWTAHPSIVAGNVRTYSERILQGLMAIGDLFAARMEAYAKANAPWSDRSGAARQGLRSFAVKEATRVVVYLVTSVVYGRWLETGSSRMAPRPIVWPTIAAHIAPIMAAARALVGGR